MKARALVVVSALTLALIGSAGAAGGKPKLVRVVKREGAITATVTYEKGSYGVRDLTLSVHRSEALVVHHRICPSDFEHEPCDWPMRRIPFGFRYVAGKQTPAVVFDLADCNDCADTFVALL